MVISGMFGRRILILVPHPDDEIVACCAAVGRARAEGAEVFALYLTHGCAAQEDLWKWQRTRYKTIVARRKREAREAARLLGITIAGFSDRPSRSLRFEMKEAAQEIKKAVADHQIDQLWIPAYEGGHTDHDTLNGLCAHLFPEETRQKQGLGNQIAESFGTAVAGTRLLDSILEFAEYNFSGGAARAQSFPSPNGTETVLRLSPEEKEIKQAALKLYASEKKNLGYVGTDRECFRLLASYDYRKPPHKGTLWYARFHWVPFRHPRIDFTKPKEVCEAIRAFSG